LDCVCPGSEDLRHDFPLNATSAAGLLNDAVGNVNDGQLEGIVSNWSKAYSTKRFWLNFNVYHLFYYVHAEGSLEAMNEN
jgi:hypothetical protein